MALLHNGNLEFGPSNDGLVTENAKKKRGDRRKQTCGMVCTESFPAGYWTWPETEGEPDGPHPGGVVGEIVYVGFKYRRGILFTRDHRNIARRIERVLYNSPARILPLDHRTAEVVTPRVSVIFVWKYLLLHYKCDEGK